MKHLLVIAYEFPPFGTSGVFRTVKFVKYLAEFDWRCTVLTVKVDPDRLAVTDSRLSERLPSSARIVRAACIDPYNLYRRFGGKRKQGQKGISGNPTGRGGATVSSLLNRLAAFGEQIHQRLAIPDAKIGWYPDAVRQGSRVIREDPPQAIFSTSPRETAHLIAYRLKARSGLPWVADFRDPWTGAFFRQRPFPLLATVNAHWEKMAVRSADAVTVTWPALKDRLAPADGTGKFFVISNGYDPDDIANIVPVQLPGFVIVYTGVFIPRQRSPEAFLVAVRDWLKQDARASEAVRIRFVGRADPFVVEMIGALGLESYVELLGNVPRTDALAHCKGADCLFLLNSYSVESKADDVPPDAYIPGKLFDYLGAGRPILAAVQKGSASAAILDGLPNVYLASPNDPSQIQTQIRAVFETWRSGNLSTPAPKPPEQYHRRMLTERLAKVLKSVTAHPQHTAQYGSQYGPITAGFDSS